LDEIPLLEMGADDDPTGPQEVEQGSIRREIRKGPNHDESKEVEGVPDPAVGAAYGKGACDRLVAANTGPYRLQSEGIERTKGLHAPTKPDDCRDKNEA